MLSQSVLTLLRYWGENPYVKDVIEKLTQLARFSRSFLELDDQRFPEILEAARYLMGRHWVLQMRRTPNVPSTVQELRAKIYYESTIESMFSLEFRFPFAALMHLVPALGPSQVLRMLWLLVEQLSFVGSIYEHARAMQIERPPSADRAMQIERIERELQSLVSEPAPETRPIRQELRPYLEQVLNVFERYWFRPASNARARSLYGKEVFLVPSNAIREMNPHVLSLAPNQAIQFQFLLESPPAILQMTPEMIETSVELSHLVFSGGYHSPIEVVNLTKVADPSNYFPDFTENVWQVTVKPAHNVDGRYIHPGPVNFIDPSCLMSVEEFLAYVRKILGVTTNRFWLPWDSEERNLLWVGPSSIHFGVREWMMESLEAHVNSLELWGAEHLWVWVDGSLQIDKDIEQNHKQDEVWLPRNMGEVTEVIAGQNFSYLLPRRYDVRIVAKNTCGNTNKTFNTGVTYPLKIRFLGAEVGQTISRGSISQYAELEQQPAFGSYSMTGVHHVYPVTPPLVRYKPTWIRLFVEHNAPLPRFSPDGEVVTPIQSITVHRPLPAQLRYTVTRREDGEERSGIVETGILYEGVLGACACARACACAVGRDRDRYHLMRTRSPQANGVLHIPLAAVLREGIFHRGGTFHLSGTVDIAPATKTDYGLLDASVPINLDFSITEPNTVRFNWIRVEPGTNTTGNPVTSAERSVLEEWLQAFVPSIRFDFRFGGTVRIGQPGKSSDDLLGKVENVQGGRDGFWIAIIDETLADQCDSSIRDWGGVAHLGLRRAWAKLKRGDMMRTIENIAHEFGHAHPNEYEHIKACGNPSAAITGYWYWRPGQTGLYPRGSCGESLFIPAGGWEASDTGNVGNPWRWPNYVDHRVRARAEDSRDIMTYCSTRGFDLKKCEEMLRHFDELS